MKKLALIILLLAAVTTLNAQVTQDAFEQFKNKSNQDFQEYTAAVNQQWDDYEKASKEAFDKFKNDIEQKWGTDNFKSSTKKDWVEYSSDQTTRTLVDFETEEATVELLLSPEEAANAELVKARLGDAVKELATTKGKSKDFTMDFEQPEPLSDEPVLKGQLEIADGEKVTESNVGEYAKEVIERKPVEKITIKGADSKERVVVSVKLPLAPNSIQSRAEKFYEFILAYARQYALDPELIFAIMHTESYFNPKARSAVPAFGLMQIVPRYAGRDAYHFVYGEDKMLSENYLYEAKNNIELGSAYLHMLLEKSFGKVNDPVSRLFCAIAAYNTGAGNVSRAFIGTTKLGNAIPKINSMTSDQVYTHLRAYLPYQETKDYVERVSKRMGAYREWMSN
ncbi:MAG: DUF3393 domain-containing protein [Bacteroidales bacterium]|nr:DUF3393 domain-containing protein [Bacteroidales bacterium]